MFDFDQSPDTSEIILPTYIENWPPALHEVSIPSSGFPLTDREARVLGSCISDYGEVFDVSDLSMDEHLALRAGIMRRMDDLLKGFPDGAFVRLGSRSPKDAWLFEASEDVKKGLVRTGEEAFIRLVGGSERIYEDIQGALINNSSTPWIWLREWVNLEPWQEFRCFSKDGELIGVSQYDYRAARFNEVAGHANEIMQAIQKFHKDSFLPACHMDPVVFDVFIVPTSSGYEVKLLEINPFFWLTDPCLFEWQQSESFQGQILFCKEEKEPRARFDPDEEI